MDPFGASSGAIGDLTSKGLSNDFSNISNNDIDTMLDANRVEPRQVASGVMRGTQRIVNTDGSYITLGEIPGTNGEFGIGYFNRDGTMIKKSTGTSDTLFDDNGTEIMTTDRTGLLFRDAVNRRIKLGASPGDNPRIGQWISPEGTDVIDLLES